MLLALVSKVNAKIGNGNDSLVTLLKHTLQLGVIDGMAPGIVHSFSSDFNEAFVLLERVSG